MALSGRLLSLNVAHARPITIDGREVMTAIGKRAVGGACAVGRLGIEGDEQADLTAHGGASKAVYAYPSEHYPFWQTVRSQAGAAPWNEPLAPGALGENLTLEGVVESAVFIGDVLRFPSCALAVSEARSPCFKLDAAMGFAHASKLMVKSTWCGWYLAVREPGAIAAGESFTVEPGPREVGIGELFRARMGRP